jgi:hypothetical protein
VNARSSKTHLAADVQFNEDGEPLIDTPHALPRDLERVSGDRIRNLMNNLVLKAFAEDGFTTNWNSMEIAHWLIRRNLSSLGKDERQIEEILRR